MAQTFSVITFNGRTCAVRTVADCGDAHEAVCVAIESDMRGTGRAQFANERYFNTYKLTQQAGDRYIAVEGYSDYADIADGAKFPDGVVHYRNYDRVLVKQN